MLSFTYRVDATRKVRERGYGPEAYRSDTKRVLIPFGKGQDIKTGREALEVAKQKAAELAPHASSVSIWRLTSAGNGTGSYVKEDPEAFFEVGWKDLADFPA